MKSKTLKVNCLIIIVVMLFTMLFVSVSAAQTIASGTCGKNLTWKLDSDGVLTISGKGDMANYEVSADKPWHDYGSSVKRIVINDGVTSIGNNAFYYCQSLAQITIPDSVTSIGKNALFYCSALTQITIPDGVTSIGSNAFRHCLSLNQITIPDSVTSIGDLAFDDCESLTQIIIPDSVTSIGSSAFCNCTSLTEIVVEEANPNYSSLNGVLYDKDKTKLIHYPVGKTETSFEIPQGVTSICSYAFYYCTSLTEIIIPDTVTSIDDRAIYHCESLTQMTIPDSVTRIGESAFYYCTSLTEIIIPDSVTSIDRSAFSCCESLAKITIPDSMTYIAYATFSGCTSLTQITIPDSVTAIRGAAFSGCDYLEITILNPECEIDDSSNTIDEGATIYGYEGSTAQAYAEKYNREFIAITDECKHKYDTVVTAPTCTEQGYTTYTCECGDTYVSDYTDAVGHSYSDGICAECGSIEDGYIAIYTKEDLNNVRNNLNGNYILMNDIVFADADFEKGGLLYGGLDDEGNGWLPIGAECRNGISKYFAFKGIFNGNGYSIVNLKMNRETSYYSSLDKSVTVTDGHIGTYPHDSFGLFAYNEGTVKNLTLVADFKIFIDNTIVVGGICGTNQGLVSDCRTEGTIYIENKTDHMDCYFGGIAGRLRGGTITRCANDIDFSGKNEASFPYVNCGGIVGGLSASANVISYCYNTGDIAILTPANSFFGGIVARTFNTEISILNCYNAGNIGYDDFKGLASGICAEFYEEMDSAAIRNCYNVGNIIAETKTTGILYCTDNVEYDDTCYYLNVSADYGCCDWDDDNYQIDKNSLFASQMKTEEAFDSFDFENVWIVDAKADYPYPQLRNNLQSTTELVRHIYSEQIAKEATCTENGIVRYTCDDCGFELDVDIKAIGHNYEKSGETAPTCTEKGYSTYTCSNCSSSYDSLYVAATGHDYKAVESAPTCTEQGYTTYTCECGDSYVSDYVKENGHSHEAVVTTPATHLTEGVMTYTCECGDTYTEAIAKTPEHTYETDVTAPTCTEQGYTTYTCECGDSYVSDYVKENGHSHEAVVTTPATHLTEGVMTYTCACGDTYTEAIAKLEGHTYNTAVTAPTCTEQGYTTYTCECGDSYVSDYVKENGHSHEAVVTTPATHITEGVMTYTCGCGDTYTEAIARLEGHTYNTAVIAPTCTEQGYTTYTCECGDSYVSDYVKENGHSHEAVVTTPATHITEGVMTYTCACGDTYTEAIDKLPEHTYNTVVIAPTCIEKGFTSYTCECGDSYKDDYINRTEHEDADGDEYCDYCDDFLGTKEEESKCSHICHKTGFMGFIWKIINFFCKLFGINPVCECGVKHY